MLTGVGPLHSPALFTHFLYKFFPRGRFRNGLQNGDCTFGDITLFRVIDQEIVFVFAPGCDLSLLDPGSVEMPAFFRNAQPALSAEIIGVGFLFFKVMFGLMQFVTVDV